MNNLLCTPGGWVYYEQPNASGGTDCIMLEHISWSRRWQELFGRKE